MSVTDTLVSIMGSSTFMVGARRNSATWEVHGTGVGALLLPGQVVAQVHAHTDGSRAFSYLAGRRCGGGRRSGALPPLPTRPRAWGASSARAAGFVRLRDRRPLWGERGTGKTRTRVVPGERSGGVGAGVGGRWAGQDVSVGARAAAAPWERVTGECLCGSGLWVLEVWTGRRLGAARRGQST